jgi:hypothetical protein
MRSHSTEVEEVTFLLPSAPPPPPEKPVLANVNAVLSFASRKARSSAGRRQSRGRPESGCKQLATGNQARERSKKASTLQAIVCMLI